MLTMTAGIRPFAMMLLFACNASLAAPCLSYSAKVTLQGTLSRQTFPEQPNYESIANGDAPATYFFITPRTPFCVAAGAGDDEPAVARVEAVQLVFTGKRDAYGPLRPYLKKDVVCLGTFSSAITGHHHSPVLLMDATCKPVAVRH